MPDNPHQRPYASNHIAQQRYANRLAQREYAATHTETIRAAQAIHCTAHEGRWNHFLDNSLTCARCGLTAHAILNPEGTAA